MGTRLTVTLPDDVFNRVSYLARLAGRDVSEMVVEALVISLQPISASPGREIHLDSLSDAEVLALAESQLDSRQDTALSALLHKQQAGILTDDEHGDLQALMQTYQERLLLKARALREAVRRGLREPLEA